MLHAPLDMEGIVVTGDMDLAMAVDMDMDMEEDPVMGILVLIPVIPDDAATAAVDRVKWLGILGKPRGATKPPLSNFRNNEYLSTSPKVYVL